MMATDNPTYLDRLRAEVAFADAHGPKPDSAPVTDSSLTYGDLREMLAVLSEINAPFSDEELGMLDDAWEKHKAAKPGLEKQQSVNPQCTNAAILAIKQRGRKSHGG